MAQSTKKKTGTGSKTGTKSKSKAAAAVEPQRKPYRREIGAVVCLFLAIFSLIGFFNSGKDGWLIDMFCGTLKGLIGGGYYLFPFALFATAGILGFHGGKPVRLRVISVMVLPLIVGALWQLLFAKTAPEAGLSAAKYLSALFLSGKELASGGAVAGLIALGLKSALSLYGAVPILLFLLLLFIVLAYNSVFGKIAENIKNRERIEYEMAAEKELQPKENKPQIGALNSGLVEKSTITGAPAAPIVAEATPKRRRRMIDIPYEDEPVTDVLEESGEEPLAKRKSLLNRIRSDEALAEAEPLENVEPLSIEDAAEIAGVTIVDTAIEQEAPTAKRKKEVVDVESETESISKIIEENAAAGAGEYAFPPLSLLQPSSKSHVDGREELSLNSDRLATTLSSFGVSANITEITRGPTVTRYDLELDAGVKLAKITGLAKDLALSLGVANVRIAPIPEKISTVGIEVPNKLVDTVVLRDIIDSPAFANAQSKISFSIGKDIGGNSIVGNIAKLPHLLIAGTTGSGKSVCMNSLIISILYKATPDEVRFIMIDPKMVELGIYNGIPHLYVPVVTEPKKAAGALQWVVVEMLKRYRLFSEIGVRNLESYNDYQIKNGGTTLPQIVTVIDELADLMLVASKEVEESICRVAQMGRAAGTHLVIATQRPSADVITGLMKANIPSRIAFAVASAMESRIILDTQGAEKLIGMGDMLYAPLGAGKPLRVQGAFVSDEEREEIINFIKSGSEAQYSDEILHQIEKAAEKGNKPEPKSAASDEPQSDYDELLPQGVEVFLDTKQASVSLLQRRLKLGYARAARLVDQMEEIGIVGPHEGSKPRQILISREQWNEMQMRGTAPMDTYQEQMELIPEVEEAEEDV